MPRRGGATPTGEPASLGLEDRLPADLYQPSPRHFPERLPQPEYPGHFEVRKVSKNGGIRWKKGWVNISHSLLEEYVGLEEVDDGIWSVHFGSVLLGRINERDHKFWAL